MSVEVTPSFLVGLKVMEILVARQSEFPDGESEYFIIEAYQNGREHGIVCWDTKLRKSYSVALFRRSSDVVVYYGEYAMQSLSGDAYENSRFFETPEAAADFIIQNIHEVRKEQNGN
jgi:hypothetical protein